MNYMFIYGHCGFPKLGVRGAAIATVLARVVEMLIVLLWAHLCRKKHCFLQGIYRTLLLPKALARRFLQKGLPIFLNEFLWAGGIAALTQCYSVRGLEIIAGLNISNALCNLLKVTPHRDCASDAPTDFSLDCEMTTKQYFVYCKEEFCKIKEKMSADGVQSRRRSLCGVALTLCLWH